MNETILFVDDEPSLLEGLQRMLRSKRSEWEMTFVSSPHEALAMMQQQCFDVVVTDMRMAEMDGAELLSRVRQICPKSVRIILSGQADLQNIMKIIASTHQYLAKPCDAEIVKAAIDRASRRRSLMKNESLRGFISQLDNIPSQPALYDGVVNELRAEKPSIEKLGSFIGRSVGMGAKVLQIVNSAFFGPKREVICVYEAVSILGIDLLRKLVLSHNIFARCDSGYIGGLKLENVDTHGVSIGNFALKVASMEGVDRREAEMCATTGLLSDIGKLILALQSPEKYQQVVALGGKNYASVYKEMELYGTSHAEVGAYLLGLWGLPDAIVDAASKHHCWEGDVEKLDFTILTALQLATTLASTFQFASSSDRLEHFINFESYRGLLKKTLSART